MVTLFFYRNLQRIDKAIQWKNLLCEKVLQFWLKSYLYNLQFWYDLSYSILWFGFFNSQFQLSSFLEIFFLNRIFQLKLQRRTTIRTRDECNSQMHIYLTYWEISPLYTTISQCSRLNIRFNFIFLSILAHYKMVKDQLLETIPFPKEGVPIPFHQKGCLLFLEKV